MNARVAAERPAATSLPAVADVVVIGAGFGGLATALTLAEAGAAVVLIEALNYPGGCASTFHRGGYAFESGATLLSGFGEGQLMQRLIERHHIDVVIDWLDPVIELVTPDLRLPIWRDRARLVESFCALPGAPVEGLRRFFSHQQRVADALWDLFASPELLPPFGLAELLRHLPRTPRYFPILPLLGKSLASVAARDGCGDFEPLRVYLDAL
ncbi:MAG: NAD(P)/FAD-dependent oxidoreductase, partial [Myxococcales bacterium]|nr:NAD(P)/FAD-dependent oxidoreductase [Myxococcales bacterium]